MENCQRVHKAEIIKASTSACKYDANKVEFTQYQHSQSQKNFGQANTLQKIAKHFKNQGMFRLVSVNKSCRYYNCTISVQ